MEQEEEGVKKKKEEEGLFYLRTLFEFLPFFWVYCALTAFHLVMSSDFGFSLYLIN